MLKVPQLDDLTYEQRVSRSISRIPAMTDQWTDFNSHDPGITVLQTYAWLTDMLTYYMNATGDVHVEKYLKLLGILRKPAQPSQGLVVLENLSRKISLPEGTGFYAGEIPFELVQACEYSPNWFSSYIQENDGVGMDLTVFAGADGAFIEVFSERFEEQSTAYFGFQNVLQNGDRIYVQVKEEERRNPFDEQFRFCDLSWEYYTEDGWMPLAVSDETCGFLKSGFVRIYPEEAMKQWKHKDGICEEYYIRCTLSENLYDSMPRIGEIYVNPLQVVQKATICREGEVLEHLQIGMTDGCANQEVLFDYPDVYRFSLLLLEKEKTTGEIWHRVDHLDEADYKEQVFSYDFESKMIRFGDGIHGRVPVQNQRIIVTGLEISRLGQGNVMQGEIRRTDSEALIDAKLYNPAPTTGGREEESLIEMRKRMEDTLFEQNRLASEADYEQIILKTPGLMIDLVHVIPGSVYGEIHRQDRGMNEVMVVVKPHSTSAKPKLSAVYRQMIEESIENVRLINTKVTVISPEYVGIEVHGKIRLQTYTEEAKEAVRRCIEQSISYQGKERPFGNVISYGQLFTRLESMDEVKRVQELALEKNGSSAVKNDRGDILCQEDALCYAEMINIEFC